MKLSKTAMVLAISIFSIPLVSAQVIDFMERGMQGIFEALNGYYIRAGLTVLLFFLILYSAILMATKRINIFQGEDGMSKQGKVFAFSLSALAALGIFFAAGQSFEQVMRNILETTQVYGMIVLGVMIFLLTYYGFRPGDSS